MKYHDWHLSGYTVSDYGSTVVLHFSWDYPGDEVRKNQIKFSEVAAYHFQHTEGAIITQIHPWPITAYFEKEKPFIESAKHTGLRYWKTDMNQYRSDLEKANFRYWLVESAIGFSGFVLAKTVEELS